MINRVYDVSKTQLPLQGLTDLGECLVTFLGKYKCSCLENPRDGGARWADVYGVTQSRTRLK